LIARRRFGVPCFPINGEAGSDAVQVWFSRPDLGDAHFQNAGAATDMRYWSGKRRANAMIIASIGTSASAGISKYTGAQMLVGGGA
jgi:hypothetical protein